MSLVIEYIEQVLGYIPQVLAVFLGAALLIVIGRIIRVLVFKNWYGPIASLQVFRTETIALWVFGGELLPTKWKGVSRILPKSVELNLIGGPEIWIERAIYDKCFDSGKLREDSSYEEVHDALRLRKERPGKVKIHIKTKNHIYEGSSRLEHHFVAGIGCGLIFMEHPHLSLIDEPKTPGNQSYGGRLYESSLLVEDRVKKFREWTGGGTEEKPIEDIVEVTEKNCVEILSGITFHPAPPPPPRQFLTILRARFGRLPSAVIRKLEN